jgi:hypothetical protein
LEIYLEALILTQPVITQLRTLLFGISGRLPLRLLPDTGGTAANKQEAARMKWERETEGRRSLIGSRPPRCERVCMSCGHCEAVQVPIVPQPQPQQEKASAAAAVTLTAAMFTYRVDGITNYKPLSWKCRCGGTILDP